ncbi:MAG TPA: hypothetical protein VNE40_00120 [Candidatus Dormibacteraeota bacterium]|nr:hypothetical protein [Candidatus Dormibacteraeota bacterium]
MYTNTYYLNNQQILKYQEIYLVTFGKAISTNEALAQALALVRLVGVITLPKKEKLNDKETHNENS